MYTDEQIKKAISTFIEKNHKLGQRAGSSGHLGFVSFKIDQIAPPIEKEDHIEVCFDYTIITETEFTYYPDNPPYESYHSATLLLPKNA